MVSVSFRKCGNLTFHPVSHIVPTALLVRVQCARKDLYKAVEGPSTIPIVLSMDDLSTSKAFDYFRARRDEFRFTSDPP